MRIGRALFLVLVSLAGVAGPARSGEAAEGTPPRTPGQAAVQVVPLGFVEGKRTDFGAQTHVTLNEEGLGEIAFPTPSGKLLVRLVGGKVVCDANGDGRIDDADGKGVAAGRGFGPGTAALKVRVTVGGRGIDYPLAVLYAQGRHLMLASTAHLAGTFRGARLSLYDTNVNGVFGEIGVDGIKIAEGGRTRAAPGFRAMTVASGAGMLGRVLAIGGELYNAEVVEGGRALRLSPYGGEKATLSLKVDKTVKVAHLTLAHTGGLFFVRAVPGQKLLVPAGTYRIDEARLSLALGEEKRSGSSWLEDLFGDGAVAAQSAGMLIGRGGPKAALVTVRPGENELAFGPPLGLEFTAYLWGDEKDRLEIEDPALVGGAGERYRAALYAQKQQSSLKSYVRAGGKEKLLSKLEYG